MNNNTDKGTILTNDNFMIGFTVDKDTYNRLTTRAIRHHKSVPQYCYDLVYNDVYRKRDNKPSNSNPSTSQEAL